MACGIPRHEPGFLGTLPIYLAAAFECPTRIRRLYTRDFRLVVLPFQICAEKLQKNIFLEMTLTRTLMILNLALFRTPYGVRHFGHRVRQENRIVNIREACIVTAGAPTKRSYAAYHGQPAVWSIANSRLGA